MALAAERKKNARPSAEAALSTWESHQGQLCPNPKQHYSPWFVVKTVIPSSTPIYNAYWDITREI